MSHVRRTALPFLFLLAPYDFASPVPFRQSAPFLEGIGCLAKWCGARMLCSSRGSWRNRTGLARFGLVLFGLVPFACPIRAWGQVNASSPTPVKGSSSNNGAAAAADRVPTLPCIARTDYAGGTASTAGNNAAPDCGTDGLFHVAALPAMRPASYHANANFAASSTTDNSVLPGNASNTVLVTKVTVSCTQTTAGIVLMKVIKRSSADSGGTSASITAVPDDSNYTAAASAPLSYTSTGPTVGTAVGNVDTYYLGCLASGTATANDIYILNLRQKPIVLRGTAQQLAVNFNNAALTGGNLNVTFEWIEVTTITP